MSRESWSVEELRSGELAGQALSKVKADGADWSGAKLRKAGLAKARLRKADLSNADLSGADLSRADLRQARLTGANLSGAKLEKADLDGADLTDADLSGADFTGSKARETVLDRAKGDGSDWSGSLLSKAHGDGGTWNDAIFKAADLVEVKFTNADFRKAKLDQSVWINAELNGVQFQDASAMQADFFLIQATDCRFDKAALQKSNFSSGRLARVSFNGANMTEAQLTGGRHEEVTFEDTALKLAGFKAVKGYDEAAVAAFAERGAKTSSLLWLKFLRLLRTSRWAQLTAALVVVAIGLFAWRWYVNPANWSYNRLDRVASEASGAGRVDAAIEYYHLMIDRFGEDPLRAMNAKSQLANLLRGRGDYDAAGQLYGEVVKATEERPELKAMRFNAELGTANVLVDKRQYDEAVAELERMARQWAAYPESARAMDLLANVEWQRGNVEEAKRAYEAIITGEQYSIDQVFSAQLALARLFRDTGHADQAIGLLKTVWENQRDVAQRAMAAGSLLIEVNLARDDIDAASAVLDELRRSYPDETQELMNAEGTIALAEQRLGKESDAVDRFRRLLEGTDDPGQIANLVSAIASGYQREGRAAEALAELDRGIQRLPSKSPAAERLRVERVGPLQTLGRMEEAENELLAISRNAKDPGLRENANFSLINIYRSRQELDKAESLASAVLKKAEDQEKTRDNIMQTLGDIAADRGDAEKAVSWWKRIRQETSDPSSAMQAYRSELYYLRNRGAAEECRRLLDDMAKRFHDNPQLRPRVSYEEADWQLNFGDTVAGEKGLAQLAENADADVASTAYNRLKDYYGNNDRVEDLAALTARFAGRFPNRIEDIWRGKMSQADLLMNNDRFEDARGLLEEVQKGAPAAIAWEAWLRLLEVRFRMGDVDEALELYRSAPAVGLGDGLVNLMSLVTRHLSEAGRFEDAIQLLRERLKGETRPTVRASLAMTLSQVLVKTGREDEARSLLEGVLADKEAAISPADRFQVRMSIGQVLAERGDKDTARAQFEAASAEATDKSMKRQAIEALVRLQVRNGHGDVARGYVEKYATDNPDDTVGAHTLWARLADEFQAAGNPAESLVIIQRIKGEVRDVDTLRLMLWTEFFAAGNLQDSQEAYKAADQLSKLVGVDRNTVENARLQKAYALVSLKQYDDAIKEFEWVLDNSKDNQTLVNALSGLMGAYSSQSTTAEADKFFGQLMTRFEGQSGLAASIAANAAQKFRSENQPDKAVTWFEKRLKIKEKPGDDAQAYAEYARFLSGERRFSAAREVCRQAEKALAGNAELLPLIRIAQADVALAEGKSDEAIEIYQNLVDDAKEPRSRNDALVRLAQLHSDAGHHEMALDLYADLRRNAGADASLLSTVAQGEADTLRKAGRVDEAVVGYRKLASTLKDPNGKAWVLGSVVQAYRDAGRAEEAIAASQDLLAQLGDRRDIAANAWSVLADIYRQLGRTDESRAALAKVAEYSDQSDNRLRALLESARMDAQGGKTNEGLAGIDAVLADPALSPSLKSDALAEKARALWRAGRIDEASGAWRETVEATHDPGQFRWVAAEYAGMLSNAGRFEQAIQALQDAAAKATTEDMKCQLLVELSNTLQQSSRYEEAEKALKRAIELGKGKEHGLNATLALGQLDLNRGRRDAAKKTFSALTSASNPPNVRVNAYQGLANIAHQQSDAGDEIAAWRGALSAAADPGAKINLTTALAFALADAGKTGEAESAVKKVLDEGSWKENDKAALLSGLAQIYAKAGKPDQARKVLDQIIGEMSETPSGRDAYRIAMDIEIGRENEAAARKLVQDLGAKVSRSDNTLVTMRQMLVNFLSSRQKWDAALKEIDAYLSNAENDALRWGVMEKVRILNELKKPDESASYLNGLIADETRPAKLRIECRVALIDVQRIQGRMDEAVKTGWDVAGKSPDSPIAIRALFQVAQIENDRQSDGSIKAYEAIIASSAANEMDVVQAHMGLAGTHERLERPTAAIAEYEKVYTKFPDRPDAGWAMLAAARLLKNHGEQAKAVALYEKAAKDFVNDPELSKNAKEALEGIFKR